MIKNVFARLFIMTNDVRFTASSFHFTERPQFFSISAPTRLPLDAPRQKMSAGSSGPLSQRMASGFFRWAHCRLVQSTYDLPTTSLARMGSRRIRWPVTVNNALARAGATGGTPGSPTPVGGCSLGTM